MYAMHFQVLQDEVIEKKPKVDRLEILMEIITTECKTEFSVCNEVSTSYENTRSQINEVWMKVEIRQNRLQETLMRSQKFQDSFDDFLDTLSHIEETMDKEKPVSAKLDTVKEQKEHHAQIHNDVIQLEPVFEQIIKAAENLIETSEPGEEIEQFKTNVDETKHRYENVQQTSVQRQKQMTNCVLFGQKLLDETTPFGKWLDEKENHIPAMQLLPCFESSIAVELKELKEMINSFDEQKPTLENLSILCNSVVVNAETDQFEIEEKLKVLHDKYKSLNEMLCDRGKKLATLIVLAQNYEKEVKSIEEFLNKVEENTVSHLQTYGIDNEKITKELENITELLKDFEVLFASMKVLDTSKELSAEINNESSELVILKKQVEDIDSRCNNLQHQLNEKHDNLKVYAGKALQYNEQNIEFSNWYYSFSNTPVIIEPIGTEPLVLKKQMVEIEVCSRISIEF